MVVYGPGRYSNTRYNLTLKITILSMHLTIQLMNHFIAIELLAQYRFATSPGEKQLAPALGLEQSFGKKCP